MNHIIYHNIPLRELCIMYDVEEVEEIRPHCLFLGDMHVFLGTTRQFLVLYIVCGSGVNPLEGDELELSTRC